ncbi:putative adhesin [Iodobacter fluviatilis]|uniref:Putative adhesin Stv domain-containing protein n=1 Tax=Iodobacter fluviatilis TaxID=537 RepID=A0A377Q7M2_9NEIS|nr:hypothetical protein EV682_102287 [Iodobacter fluviatilis]STQ90745.1 Uncharacterised protein [Iodobacter fluviatilis]
MPRIIVNCHGGRVIGFPAHPGPFLVPVGISIHFYVLDGGILDNETGWHISNQRMRGEALGGVYHHVIFGGQMCQDYYGLPYAGLGISNGIFLEELNGRRGENYIRPILQALGSQRWGNPEPNTINPMYVNLPAVQGGGDYPRAVVTLSDIANCPGVTDVDWIACREHW